MSTSSQFVSRRQAQPAAAATANPLLSRQLYGLQAHTARPLAAFHTSSFRARPDAPAEAAPAAGALEKPDFLNDAESEIWERLVKEFGPVELVVQDISGGCGSMYGIEISSEKFRGANMLKQQRMVNAVLGDLMKEWHGCQLKTRVPS